MNHRRNIVVYFFGKLVPALSTLLIMYLGLRFLGKSEFGRYNLIFNTTAIIVTLMIGWIQQGLLRFNTSSQSGAVGNSGAYMQMATVPAIIATVSMLIVSLTYYNIPVYAAMLVSLFTGLFCIYSTLLTQFQSRFEVGKYVVSESAYHIISIAVILVMLFVIKSSGFSLFFTAMVLSLVAVLTYHRAAGFLSLLQMRRSDTLRFARKIFNYGFPVTIWLFISGLFNVVDRYMIREFYSYQEVGVYGSVYDFIYKLCGFASIPVLLTMHPAITKAWDVARPAEARSLVARALWIEGAILILMLVAIAAAGDLIFNLVFGLELENLATLTIPLVLSAMLWQMALFIHKPLELTFRQNHMIAGILLSIGSNFLFNLWLLPEYGYRAAAYTTLGSTMIYIGYVLFITHLTKFGKDVG